MMTFEPRYHVAVKRLITTSVGDEGTPHPAKGPDGERREGEAYDDCDDDGDRQRDKLRHMQLQSVLKRPDDSHDEECEHQWRKNARRLISGK